VGATFSAPVQAGPGAHPGSCTMASGSFPGVKRPGRGVNHPPVSSAEAKERVELYVYSHSGPPWPVLRVNFALHSETWYGAQWSPGAGWRSVCGRAAACRDEWWIHS
jgi:hypothetical protein